MAKLTRTMRQRLQISLFASFTCAAIFSTLSLFIGPQTLDNYWEVLSFKRSDRPGLPDLVTVSHGLVGRHYFGDFTQIVQLTRLPTPYSQRWVQGASQYLPVAHLIMAPLTFLKLTVGLIVFLSAALFFFFYGLWRAFRAASIAPALCAGLVFAGPLLSAVDRGNQIVLAVGLMVLAIQLPRESRNQVAAFALAVSIKPYLIIVLLGFVVSWKQYRLMLKILICAIVLNLTGMMVFQDSYIANWRQWFRAISGNFDGTGSKLFNHSAIQHLTSQVQLSLVLLTCTLVAIVSMKEIRNRSSLHSLLTCSWTCLALPMTPYYQFLIFVIPFVELCRDQALTRRQEMAALILIGLVVSPKQILISQSLRLSQVFDPVLLSMLVFCVLWISMEERCKY